MIVYGTYTCTSVRTLSSIKGTGFCTLTSVGFTGKVGFCAEAVPVCCVDLGKESGRICEDVAGRLIVTRARLSVYTNREEASIMYIQSHLYESF